MAVRRGRAAAAVVLLMASSPAGKRGLSIIIPVLNEADSVADFLGQLSPWREFAEIIVVDGGSSDATVRMARAHCDQLIITGAGRARQMNAGAAHTQADYLLFLHCDTELACPPQAFFDQLAGTVPWGFFRVRLSGADYRLRIIEWFMNFRSRHTRIATGDQAIFVAGPVWLEMGGYADIPLMEDIELCSRLRRVAAPHIVSPPVVTSSRRWERHGILTTVLTMWRLRLAFWLGVAPERLARSYYG
jgi:rSAM/selenodomain-associated transferase 2